jgi:N-methylhydantoinase B/oxoprolinase/acetone carboxylase alpha subunit
MSDTNALDTIRMQVMWNRLLAVVEEQAQTLMRTAFSPIVRECGDAFHAPLPYGNHGRGRHIYYQ